MKPKRKKLEDKIYKKVCEIVHARGKCELCGKSDGKLDLHHIQGRTGQLKYCLANCILLCFNCHRRGVHNEASHIQAKFRQAIIDKRGDIDDVVRLKDQKLGIIELEELLNLLEKLKEL